MELTRQDHRVVLWALALALKAVQEARLNLDVTDAVAKERSEDLLSLLKFISTYVPED